MAAINDLTEQFIQHGIYLRGWSTETVRTYGFSLSDCPEQITKASLNAAVIAMRERGLSPGGINLRARSIHSFLTWAHDEGHLPERLRIKLLKNPPELHKALFRHVSKTTGRYVFQKERARITRGL